MADRKLGWLFLPALGLVGCDHATKAAAKATLTGHVKTVVPGVLDLRYAENHDTAFNLFRRFDLHPSPGALATLASLALLALVVVLWRRRRDATRLEQAGFLLVFAGAAGNLLDRVVRGYVVDFIHLHHWPVFNVADIAVVVGAGLLLLAGRQGDPRATSASAPPLGRAPPQ